MNTSRLVLFCLCLSTAFASELPRGPVAAERESAFRMRAAKEKLASSSVHAFLKSLADDDLLLTSTDDLLDDLRVALESREKFPWTKTLAEADFNRYVVPPRISGEPLQRYRRILFTELSQIVSKCSTAADAALEVNLWLGQRVTFKPTDRREQGVLTTLSCGFGRCGEETIIATAAMRSVGIPARMVYVPYWAHQNDNHAWVEVKVGDRWNYIGACEPEAALNRAWFDEPVMRAPILMARVAGVDSTEADALRGVRGWQINSTRNYFEPCRLQLEFSAEWSDSSELWLSVFNYGGIFQMARIDAKHKRATLETGAGDFLLFGRHLGKLFVQRAHTEFGTERTLEINPSMGLPDELLCEFPQPKKTGNRESSAEWQYKLELGRKQLELTQRMKNDAPDWLPDLGLKVDSSFARLAALLVKAPGNTAVLRSHFLPASPNRRALLLEVLETLTDKDLRQVDSLTLDDFVSGASLAVRGHEYTADSLRKYVVSPRISYENPRAWRQALLEDYAAAPSSSVRTTVEGINRAVQSRIADVRPLRPLDPHTLFSAKKIAQSSALILACGLLRNAGIPAFATEGEKFVSFHDGKEWLPLYPDQPEKLGVKDEKAVAWFGAPANVILSSGSAEKLELWNSFNVAPLNEGWPDYNAEGVLFCSDPDTAVTLSLVPGEYLLSWGLRNSRGDVQFGARMLSVKSGDSLQIAVPLHRPADPNSDSDTLWSVNAESASMKSFFNGEQVALFVFLAEQHEPSVRMNGLLENLSVPGCPVIPIYTQPADLLNALKVPASSADFRNGAPYYRLISANGKVLAAGNGYRLDIASVVAAALAK